MIRERAVPVLQSVLIIVLVAQERSRYLGAIIAAMPLIAPLAMWIVFSASQGGQRQTASRRPLAAADTKRWQSKLFP